MDYATEGQVVQSLQGFDYLDTVIRLIQPSKPTISTKTETLKFKTITENDGTLPKGQTKVIQAGKNGTREITYEITYTNNKETSRKIINKKVTPHPVNQITRVGTYVAPVKPTDEPKQTIPAQQKQDSPKSESKSPDSANNEEEQYELKTGNEKSDNNSEIKKEDLAKDNQDSGGNDQETITNDEKDTKQKEPYKAEKNYIVNQDIVDSSVADARSVDKGNLLLTVLEHSLS